MKFVDLTQTISPNMQVYPGTEPPVFQLACTIEKDGFKEVKMQFYSHTGTHMDSPAHIFTNGKSLDKFPIDSFYGKGVLVDCTNVEEGKEITEDYIAQIEDNLNEAEFILFYTGWDKKWGDNRYFEGFPTISTQLADRLCKLNIKGIGIDAISVEPVTSINLEIHQKILGQEILIIENLTGLEALIGKEFSISAFPLKTTEADGSPIRAVAFIEE
ncbi:cyclase family protein [Clostridium sp. Cult1]|uniref:cyclase family protein n=1 Tax=Clostridium sp. Cult1 TaxID=2079002 RepID=UPI001F3A68D9|nr:cyclase family protein [Clostridium sp. Cult1]MCF6462355.1 hydrolase [Clostridium sp. Cult1]